MGTVRQTLDGDGAATVAEVTAAEKSDGVEKKVGEERESFLDGGRYNIFLFLFISGCKFAYNE